MHYYYYLIHAADASHVTALALLDTVCCLSLQWFQSYLNDQTQTFLVNSSITHHVNCNVPQGSSLGRVEIIAYKESVTSVFECLYVNHHLPICSPTTSRSMPALLEGVNDVHGRLHHQFRNWCAFPQLQLNENKTRLA